MCQIFLLVLQPKLSALIDAVSLNLVLQIYVNVILLNLADLVLFRHRRQRHGRPDRRSLHQHKLLGQPFEDSSRVQDGSRV